MGGLGSARLHSLTMHISRRSLHRILKADLKFHPYKLRDVHELRPIDPQMRIAFCEQLQKMIAANNILPNSLMPDETHFHLIGFVNKQNYRYWSDTNPQLLHKTPLHCPKVRVRCSIARFGINGPYFSRIPRTEPSLLRQNDIFTCSSPSWYLI